MELRPAIFIRSGGLSLAAGVSSSPEIVEALTTRYSPPGGAFSTSRPVSSPRANPTSVTSVTKGPIRIVMTCRWTGHAILDPAPASTWASDGHLGKLFSRSDSLCRTASLCGFCGPLNEVQFQVNPKCKIVQFVCTKVHSSTAVPTDGQ